ncbi:MAG: hypothetical protein PHN39_03280 [Candidatus Pacebacteria bacterium]|nr:hypothetical protein [Candidatus Paceibacterota bacterium]
MNFEDLKNLVNETNEKLVFIENGKPSFVLLSFEDYRKIVNGQLPRKQNVVMDSGSVLEGKEEVSCGIQLPPHNSVVEPKEIIAQVTVDTAKELKLEDLPF